MIQRTSRWRWLLPRIIAGVLLLPVAVVGGYVAWVFMNYHRLPDSAEQHSQNISNRAALYQPYTVATWNVGYGANSADFSFFMDGGDQSRASSPEAVQQNLGHAAQVLKDAQVDHILLQEVDTRATRSWHIDELDLLRLELSGYQNYFVRNYNSPYLLYPFNQPMGEAQSGLVSFSKLDIYRGERHSLPVETGLIRVLDLDRCYSIIRIPTTDGRQLCLYNLHLSAYTSDGSVATRQLEMVLQDMVSEYRKGNYCVAGGDFNKDLVGHSDRIFGVKAPEGLTWNQPIDRDMIPKELKLVESLDKKHPVPTCRNLDAAYEPGKTYVLTADGFIVSNNVETLECRVIDEGFAVSDHNPVLLTFQLITETEAKHYELGPYKAVSGL